MALGDKIKSHTVQDNIRTSPVSPSGSMGVALVAALASDPRNRKDKEAT